MWNDKKFARECVNRLLGPVFKCNTKPDMNIYNYAKTVHKSTENQEKFSLIIYIIWYKLTIQTIQGITLQKVHQSAFTLASFWDL